MAVSAKAVKHDKFLSGNVPHNNKKEEPDKPSVFDTIWNKLTFGAGNDTDSSGDSSEDKKSVFDTILNKLSFGTYDDTDDVTSAIDEWIALAKQGFSTAKEYASDLVDKAEDYLPSPQPTSTAKPIFYSDWSPAAKQFGMDQNTAYSEHMINTAHQREVADLRAAGLNPVLGVGSGASGVSGHVATSGASAQKFLNGDFIVDAIGATAAFVTAILTKNPAYGALAGNAVNAIGDIFTNSKS